MKNTVVLSYFLLLVAALAQAKLGPSERFLQDGEHGGCQCTVSHPCTECERCDCDSSYECSGHLVCYQRNAGDPVPGCPHIGTGGNTDFCAPRQTPHPTRHPTPHPTPHPVQPTVPAPTPAPTEGDYVFVVYCFSGDTTVEVLQKGAVPMKELQVGDKVLTGSDGYETVYAFAHYHPTKEASFMKLHTSDHQELEITREHLLYIKDKANPVRASAVTVGDQLVPSGATVTKISTSQKQGIYAPLTGSGKIVVNGGIQASSYASLVQDNDDYFYFQNGTPFLAQHDAIHLFLAPFRLACQSFATCENPNPDTGMHAYVDYGIQLLGWVSQQSMVVQVMMLTLAVPVFGLSYGLEQIMAGGGLYLLVLGACGMVAMANKRKTKTKEL